MIINEQSANDLIKDGWTDKKPKDYNSKDYLAPKRVNRVRYYKRRDGKPIDQSNVGEQTFDGTYSTNFPGLKKVIVYKSKDENGNEALYLTSIYFKNIPQLKDYTILKLEPKENSTVIFTISGNGTTLPDSTITFTDNGFIFKYKIPNINRNITISGTKEEEVTTNKPTDKKDDKKKVNVVTTKKTDDKKSNIPIVKSKPLYFNNDQKDATPKKDCSDFPFTLGCVNSKIGDLNAKFFRGNRYEDMYNKQLEKFLDNRGYFSDSKNELTRDTWEYLMNVNIIKESVKKVLKEYINKIK